MRAIRIFRDGGQNRIVFEEDEPMPKPEGDRVLVQVVASAINPSDVLNVAGKFPHTTYPRIPGRDFSGIIIATPPSSIKLVGTQVYGTSGCTLSFTEDGAHAEYVLVPTDSIAPKPKTLSFVQAAVVGTPFTTAMLVLKRTGAKKDDSILVLGASGAVGTAVCQMARKLGCRVIGAARRAGFDVALKEDPDLMSVQTLTQGNGVDICVDTVGDVDLMRRAINRLTIGGRLGVISVSGTESELKLDVRSLYRSQHSIVGCNSVECSVATMATSLREIGPWFDSGELDAPQEQSLTTISIDNVKAAYEDTMSGRAKGKKFVLVNKATNQQGHSI